MSTPTLPPEAPVNLRAATGLSTPPAEHASASVTVDAQAAAPAPDDGALAMDAVTLVAAAAVLALVTAWALQRRRRPAQQEPAQDTSMAPSSDGGFEPSELSQPQRRRRSVPAAYHARKALMKFFMALRSVAGALAILAAIAIVVFWSIELIDSSARESGLTLTLLGFLLAGGAGYWCSGRVANMLHRSVYNRDHPKFAD